MRRSIFAVILVAVASGAAFSGGAAAAAPAAGDPWEGLNRRGYAINQFLDKLIIRPAAMIYKALTPGPIGKGLHNLVVNLGEPIVVINDVLQARPARAASATVRFAFNSTFGLAGLIDLAGRAGFAHHDSSFGDTLGRYGMKPGPYLFIPLIGPSTVRDLVGVGVDAAVDPVHFVNYRYRTEISTSTTVVGGLDTRAGADEDLKAILADAADPYATLRSVFLQYRQGEIDGVRGGAKLPPLPDLDEPAPPTSTPPSAEKAAPAPPRGALIGTPGELVALRPSPDQPTPLEGLPDQ